MADVLVVEDAKLQQAIIRSFLEEDHTVVGTATNGSDAVELAAAVRPEVVIMDINLPDVDGITAAERIRYHDPGTKIVVSTAVVTDDAKASARDVSVDAYLVKPYAKRELLDAIERAVS